jgi:hypothetical protein
MDHPTDSKRVRNQISAKKSREERKDTRQQREDE